MICDDWQSGAIKWHTHSKTLINAFIYVIGLQRQMTPNGHGNGNGNGNSIRDHVSPSHNTDSSDYKYGS